MIRVYFQEWVVVYSPSLHLACHGACACHLSPFLSNFYLCCEPCWHPHALRDQAHFKAKEVLILRGFLEPHCMSQTLATIAKCSKGVGRTPISDLIPLATPLNQSPASARRGKDKHSTPWLLHTAPIIRSLLASEHDCAEEKHAMQYNQCSIVLYSTVQYCIVSLWACHIDSTVTGLSISSLWASTGLLQNRCSAGVGSGWSSPVHWRQRYSAQT